MQLLYVIDSLVPAGAERSLAALAPRLVDRGVGLHVAYLHDRPGLHAELEDAGATLSSLAGDGGRVGWVRRATRLCRERRPDLVHTTLFEANVTGRVAARLAAVPVVSSVVNETYGPDHVGDPNVRAWKVRSAQALDAATARLTVRLHVVSAAVADTMARRLRYPRDRIDVVPRGRDPERLGTRTAARRATARAQLGLADTSRVLLAVTRQEHHKGLDVLLAALPRVRGRLPEVTLLVVGREGADTPALHRLARETGLDDAVRFLGIRDDVAELMCAADVLVLPSRREGLPGSVLEAMALELPIVVSDLPQVREVLAERDAWFVVPGSTESLAEAIVSAVSDATGVAARTRRARAEFLGRFAIESVADRMMAFYERSLAPRPQSDEAVER